MAEHGGHAHSPQEYHPPVEEYLETMLGLAEEGVPVIQARIAERLGRSAPSVSEMLDRLIDDGYVSREGRRLSLTDSGRALAEKVVRKHRLAERLLVDVIGLEWHKVHREAGRWEHVISDDVEARLVELLGDPATCPHGNPIPGSHSPAPAPKTRPLAEVAAGRAGPPVAHQRGGRAQLRLAHPARRGRVHPRCRGRGRRARRRGDRRSHRGRARRPSASRATSPTACSSARRDAVTLRLEADAVFTVDQANTVLAPGAVEIADGVISWVGDPWQVPAAPGTTVRQLGGVLMPGLVNCHGHSPMTLVRSAGDGLPLERWLHEAVWPREGRMSDDDVYWGMTLGAAELLGYGVTTTCEQYRHPAAVAEAALDAGIRTLYTVAIFDVPDGGPENSWEALLAGACELFDRANGKEGRFGVGFGPHAAYTVPPDALRAIAAEAQRRDALFQIHLSETAAECAVVRDRYGMSAPALLASLGAFDGRALAAHAVWLDDDDLDLLAAHDVAVAHCPGSNGKLGSGVAPLAALMRARRACRARAPTAPPPTTTCTCGTRCAWRRSLPAPRRRTPTR